MGFIDHRVTQLVTLIAEFQHRALQGRAFFHTEALCKAAGSLIADNNLQRDDLHFFNQCLAVAQLFDKMGRNTLFLQELEQVIGHFVVDNTLAGDCPLLQSIECCGVVLIIDNTEIAVIRGKNFFCLAFIKLFFLLHCFFPPV